MQAAQPQQQQGFGAFGLAPSMGVARYNTGIPSGPSTSPEQMSQLQGIFQGMGTSPVKIGPYAPSAGSGNNPQQQAVSDSMKMLLKQAGAQGGTDFANTVNKNESDLAYNQADANSKVGLGMQKLLGDQYSSFLGRAGEYNAGLVQNSIRNQGLLANLMGSLLGPLTSSLGSGVGGMATGGALG